MKQISAGHTKILDKWINEGAFVKFVGDNVDKQVNVRDIRSDHHGKMVHMFSVLAVKARVSPPALLSDSISPVLHTDRVDCFLPSTQDITTIHDDLKVLVSRILCEYINALQELKRLVTKHIPHIYSDEMATKSEVAVLDVLHNNEIEGKEMVEIMRTMTSYLGTVYQHRALSGE